jgi:hypothetical protein
MAERIAMALAVGALFVGLAWIASESADCEAKGGVLVRQAMGLPECVQRK